MTRFLSRVELVFLVLLGIAMIAIFAYQRLWLDPGKRCEAAGNWWDPANRVCGHVVYLPDITHRPPGSKAPVYPGLPASPEQAAAAASGPAK